MPKTKRVFDVLFGILMLLIGLSFFLSSIEAGFEAMLFILDIGMTVRGLRILYYYLTMARYKVGGKSVLYRGLIALDLGVVAGSLVNHPLLYTVIYLAILHTFSGAVSVLRARESRMTGGHWRLKMMQGVTNILLAAAVVVGVAVLKKPAVAVYIYGAGLMYSAVLRISSAFRKTSIVYIQ